MIEEIAQDLHLTVAPPSGLAGRGSTAISPKETSLRRTNKRESELTEFADEARHGQAPIKPVAKPTAHPEFRT